MWRICISYAVKRRAGKRAFLFEGKGPWPSRLHPGSIREGTQAMKAAAVRESPVIKMMNKSIFKLSIVDKKGRVAI